MRLRALVVALIVALAPYGIARAQDATAAAPVADTVSESELALRDFYRALFFDTGIYDAIVQALYPSARQNAVNSDYYRRARRREREALDQLFDSLPQILREEVIAESGVMAHNIRERADSIMSADDIRAMSAMMRDPELRPLMQRLAVSGAQGSHEEPTSDERAQMEASGAVHLTPAAMERGGELMELVLDEMNAAETRLQARLQQRLAREMCAALGSRCPRDLREQAT